MKIIYLTRPCAHCHVYTRLDCLVDVAELLGPTPILNTLVCEECEHELHAELHDDPTCDCRHCDRMRAKADRAQREAAARAYGGLSPVAHELLGPGWLDEGGSSMSEQLTKEDHAALSAIDDIEREIRELRRQPVTRERTAMALFMIGRYFETAAFALGELESEGKSLLQNAELLDVIVEIRAADKVATVARFARRYFVAVREQSALPGDSEIHGPYDTREVALQYARALRESLLAADKAWKHAGAQSS